jgi:flagellar basal-body rod protein FlgB
MRLGLLESPESWAVKAGLDYAALNQRLISDNIANVDTPRYKAVKLNFDQYFEQARKAVEKGNKPDVPDARDYVFRDESTTMRLDGNNVDPEREMAELASNSLYYSTLIEIGRRRDKITMLALTEGKA